jgi:hypothetical protein
MKKAISWLQDNPTLGEDVRRSFQSDTRLKTDALPDAVAADPTLLSDMAKELVCLSIKQDAPEGVVEELMVPLRAMTSGAKELAKSTYFANVLHSLRGLRSTFELEQALNRALPEAGNDADRSKLRKMIEVVQKSASGTSCLEEAMAFSDDAVTLSDSCVPCCFIGCVVCTLDCLFCCLIGCLVC